MAINSDGSENYGPARGLVRNVVVVVLDSDVAAGPIRCKPFAK